MANNPFQTSQKGAPAGYLQVDSKGFATLPGKATEAAKKRKELKRLSERYDRDERVRAAKESGEFDAIRARYNEEAMRSGSGMMMDERGDIVERSYGSMPKGRATGGVRRKDETREEFKARMAATGLPRGLGRGGGLDAYYAQQDRNLTPEEARIKAAMIRSEGGRINRDGSMSKNVAPATRSSIGSEYDPVANRRLLMQTGRAAVQERKNLQKSDQQLAQMREAEIRKPGYQRSISTPYGTVSAKTLSKSDFAARKPATVTVGRYVPQTLPMKDEVDFMNLMFDRKKQAAADAALRRESELASRAKRANPEAWLGKDWKSLYADKK